MKKLIVWVSIICSVLLPAKPTYSSGADIKTFIVYENKLEPEYKDNGTITGMSNGNMYKILMILCMYLSI